MGIKSSTIAAPINNLVKYFSHENSPLDKKFSKDAYQAVEPQTKLALIQELEVVKKEKKRVSDTWKKYLFRIECIRSAVILVFLIASYKDRELSQALKGKMGTNSWHVGLKVLKNHQA